MFDAIKSRSRELAILGAVAVPALASAQTAADPFAATITQLTSTIATYGAALVGLAAVGVVFMVAIKYVKKIRGAA